MTAARMRNYLNVPDDRGSLTLRVTPERVVGGSWSTQQPIRARDKVQEFRELVYTFSFAPCREHVMREIMNVVRPLVRFQVRLDVTPI